MAENISMAQPSLFFPYFGLTFNERIYEYGDKVKLQQPVETYYQKKTILGKIA